MKKCGTMEAFEGKQSFIGNLMYKAVCTINARRPPSTHLPTLDLPPLDMSRPGMTAHVGLGFSQSAAQMLPASCRAMHAIVQANEIEDSLADEEHIHRTEIKLVEVGQGCETIVCRVLASIELSKTIISLRRLIIRSVPYPTMMVLPLYWIM